MNIVDKILVDPITRGLKFFTKGGVPAYITQVRGRTDGSSPAAGEIGEKLAFTSRTIAANTGWTASAALTTLTKGTWSVYGTTSAPASGTAGVFVFRLSTNNSSDATGLLGDGSGCQYIANGTYGVDIPLSVQTITVAADTIIYGKALLGGGTANVNMSGHAVRVG